MRRRYFEVEEEKGYPAGPKIYYECTRCGTVLASKPKESISCICSNIIIDVEYGRLTIRNFGDVRFFIEDAHEI